MKRLIEVEVQEDDGHLFVELGNSMRLAIEDVGVMSPFQKLNVFVNEEGDIIGTPCEVDTFELPVCAIKGFYRADGEDL